MANFTESVVEDAALAWLESLGYTVKHLPAPQNDATRQAGGPEIAPGEFLPQDGNSCKNATSRFNGNMKKMHISSNDGNPFLMGNSSMPTVDATELRSGLGTTEDCSVVRN